MGSIWLLDATHLPVVFALGRASLESLLNEQGFTVLVYIDPLLIQDWCLERWQWLDVCQWVTYLNVWQQTIIPYGVEQLMLIAPRVALEQGFAVFTVTDR
jgi:hypothetical protein